MRRLALALVIFILSASTASSYTLITNPELFYSKYQSPRTVIDFTELKDGTAIENLLIGYTPPTFLVSNSTDTCLMPADEKAEDDSPATLAVSSQAFSDDWSFHGADPARPGLFCELIRWFVQGITCGQYHMAVSVAGGRAEPFAMYTTSGFIGVIPTSPKETLFIFDNINTVFGFETGYSNIAEQHKILTPEKEATVSACLNQKRCERQTNAAVSALNPFIFDNEHGLSGLLLTRWVGLRLQITGTSREGKELGQSGKALETDRNHN
jgi:hypothetical protein